MEIDRSIINLYCESELQNEIRHIKENIKKQIKLCNEMEEALALMVYNRVQVARNIRKENRRIVFQRNLAKAERIERKISTWMEIHWVDFKFLYRCSIDIYQPNLIHSNSQKACAVLPRQIMMYYINKYSGFGKSEIAQYYEYCKGASAVIDAIKTIENLMTSYTFREKMQQIKKSLQTITELNIKERIL